MCRYYSANNGVKPGCLLVYRDGVSDSELERVRVDEVAAITEVGGWVGRWVGGRVDCRHNRTSGLQPV
jgi:hypothetical protein